MFINSMFIVAGEPQRLPVLLIVPSVRGSGRDGPVLESVWTGRTAVDGMDGHLLHTSDRQAPPD